MATAKQRQIRTLSQLTDKQATEPHRVFMKVSTLEMEKSRRQQERHKAMQRIEKIDNRIQEIDSEVTRLLSILKVAAPPTPSQQPPQPQRTQGHKFILKY